MRSTLLVLLISGIAVAFAQQAPPDVFNVNTPGQSSGTPLQAFANLYQVAAEMTASPGTDYDPNHGPKPDFPYPSDVQQQWRRAMASGGNQLTTDQRRKIIPCVAHLNAAIDSMERGYRIEISQKNNAPAQQSAQKLYAAGRAEFAQCSGAEQFASNGGPGTSPQQPLKGGVSKGPGDETSAPPPSGGLPLPPDVRQQLLKSAAEMDRIATNTQASSLAATNRFFKCLAEAVAADMRFLAQPGYVPAAQMGQSLHQGTWDYLTNNGYGNNRQMFQGAVDSLRRFQQDPACAFANLVPGAVAVAATHAAGAAADAALARKAAAAVESIAEANTERRAAFGALPKNGPLPKNPYNADCAPNMCAASAFAEHVSLDTGVPVTAVPFAGNVEIQIVKGVPTKVYNLIGTKTFQSLLGSFFGFKKLQGKPLSAARLANQARGIATEMKYWDIRNDLRDGGPGARGMAILEYPKTGVGHVVTGDNVGNKVGFHDPSNSGIDAQPMFARASKIYWYRTQ